LGIKLERKNVLNWNGFNKLSYTQFCKILD
jgi:hypothetical protein